MEELTEEEIRTMPTSQARERLPALLSIQQVSIRLGIPYSTLAEHVREDKIPSLRVGRHVRIRRSYVIGLEEQAA